LLKKKGNDLLKFNLKHIVVYRLNGKPNELSNRDGYWITIVFTVNLKFKTGQSVTNFNADWIFFFLLTKDRIN